MTPILVLDSRGDFFSHQIRIDTTPCAWFSTCWSFSGVSEAWTGDHPCVTSMWTGALGLLPRKSWRLFSNSIKFVFGPSEYHCSFAVVKSWGVLVQTSVIIWSGTQLCRIRRLFLARLRVWSQRLYALMFVVSEWLVNLRRNWTWVRFRQTLWTHSVMGTVYEVEMLHPLAVCK